MNELKHRLIHFRFLDTFTGNVVVFLVEFHADEVSFFLNGCHCGSATAHTVVEYQVVLIGIRLYKILDECDWLLSGVYLWMWAIEVEYRLRIFQICHNILCPAKLAVAPVSLFALLPSS